MKAEYCVYEHWRPDTGQCFYVGKGTLKRAKSTRRPENSHYTRIVQKLLQCGLEVKVVLFKAGVTETVAFFEETARIKELKANGVLLCNRTDGGEGSSGAVRSEAFKASCRDRHLGKQKPHLVGIPHSEEHKAKISAALKGRLVSQVTRDKISAAQKGKPRPELIGRKLSEEGLERLKSRIFSPEHRAKISAAKKGKPKSESHKAALSAAALAKRAQLER